MARKRLILRGLRLLLRQLPLVSRIEKTRGTAAPITIRGLVLQKILRINGEAYWPMHPSSTVTHPHRIAIGIATAPGLSGGCYIQGNNGIVIGDYTLVAPNVGLVSASHTLTDYSQHEPSRPIRIGSYCWIGMNAVVLAGVELGDHTVVGAGAVVTDSFPGGYVVVGGVPARVLRQIDRSTVVERRNRWEFIGFHEVTKASRELLMSRLGVSLPTFLETSPAAPGAKP